VEVESVHATEQRVGQVGATRLVQVRGHVVEVLGAQAGEIEAFEGDLRGLDPGRLR